MNEEEQGRHYQTLPHGAVSASNYFQSKGFPDHGLVPLLSKSHPSTCPVHPEPTRKSWGGRWGFTFPVHPLRFFLPLAKGIWGGGEEQPLVWDPGGSRVTHPCNLAPWHHGWSLHEVPRARGDGRLQGVAEILGFNLKTKIKNQRNCGMREQGWAVGSRGWKRLLSGNFQLFPWLEIMVIPALHSIPWTVFLLCQAQSPPLIYSIKTANNQFQAAFQSLKPFVEFLWRQEAIPLSKSQLKPP